MSEDITLIWFLINCTIYASWPNEKPYWLLVRQVIKLFVLNVWLWFYIVFPVYASDSSVWHSDSQKMQHNFHTLLFYPLIRCFLQFLILSECCDVFRTWCVDMADCDTAAVGLEVAQRGLTHNHTWTWFFGFRVAQLGLRPLSVSNDFLFLTHIHTRTEFQVHICCCSLDVLYSQCVQIILANNFLFPVSDSATSCPWSCIKSSPMKHKLYVIAFFLIHTKWTSSFI